MSNILEGSLQWCNPFASMSPHCWKLLYQRFDSTILHNEITSREMYGIDTKISFMCLFYTCHKWHLRRMKQCTYMDILYCAIEKLLVHVVFKETDVMYLLCQNAKYHQAQHAPSWDQICMRYAWMLTINIVCIHSINSFWPSYTECHQRSWSTLAGFRMALHHYLNLNDLILPTS